MSRSRPVLPYRVLAGDSVAPSALGWAVVVGNETLTHVSDGGALSAWDAQLAFRLVRDFLIVRDPVEALGLQDRYAHLELVVSCATGGGITREVLFRENVPAQEGVTVRVEVSPPSDRLARELLLTTGLYLASAAESATPLAPRLAGSRLWELTERVRLEGGAARLPMYAVPFSKVFAGDGIDDAEFHVEIAHELDMEIEAGLSVYVNTERPDFVAEVSQRGSAAERRLWSGILRRVLLQAVLSGAIEDLYPENRDDGNTLIATVRRWAGFVWPDMAPARLRELTCDRYALCEAQIDAWLANLEESLSSGRRA